MTRLHLPICTVSKPRLRHGWAALLLSFTALLAGCSGIEDKRIRQLLNEKGFGSRAEGVATLENYVAGGDMIQFIVDPSVYLQSGAEQLYLLNQPQVVSIDGTIFIPYVGALYVLGMTERDLSSLVSQQLSDLFTFQLVIQVRIISTGKALYMFGEVASASRRVPITKADMTLIDLLSQAPITPLANLGKVSVIRPDAANPLVIEVNYREMVTTGNTTYNLRLQDNDIIYVPPTFLGHIARFLEKLLAPLAVVVNAMFGVAFVRGAYSFAFSSDPLLGNSSRF